LRKAANDGESGSEIRRMSDPNVFDPVEDAIAAIAAGRLVVVADDEDRENEGDLIMAAEKATPETVNMMIRYGSGIVCVPMTGSWLDRLGLGPMVARNREVQRTDFAVSVDAAAGISTGVSAYDRTVAIRTLASADARPEQLVQPGHIFPLRAKTGGVLERAGHTEAAVDLALLAGLSPAGVICELVNDDGSMQRLPQLIEFKRRFGLKMISIGDLIAYRLRRDTLVEKVSEGELPTRHGLFHLQVFRSRLDRRHHLALSLGDLSQETPPLVRVQTANPLADVFGPPGDSRVVDASLAAIAAEGRGVLVYMEPAGGAEAVVKQLSAAPGRMGALAMDLRDYGIGAQILRSLGLRRIRVLTRHPRKVVGLEAYGIELVEQRALNG
jgi:3,4-dihydroxy 2-butanone 4-phosphate synthase/GTP cyclohydrolase II